jgi:GntR family transcriptional regulator, transcriptional repressor for pyruvate dehydrogenase complex
MAAWAARRADRATIKRIGGAVEAYEDAIKDGRPGSHADFDLHYVIAEATRNRFFVSVMTSLRDHIVFGMNLSRDLSRMKPTARLKAVREEHRRVFDAIRARDPARAYEAMRVHVEEARFRIFEGRTKPVASAIGTDQRVPHDVPET